MATYPLGPDVGPLTVRDAGTAGLLFAVGTVLGLVAALVVPTPAAGAGGGTGEAAPDAQPVVANADESAACTSGPLARRAAQVLVVGLPQVTSGDDPLIDEVVDLGVGGVFLTDSNVVDTAQVQELTAELHSQTSLPLIVTTDEEAGRVSTFRSLIGATSSPRTLAARGDTATMRAFARELGAQLAALGVNADLAPVLDLDDGPSAGVIGDRSFSSDPLVATDYGKAFSAGLLSAGVVPVIKHFPGHGRASADVHRRSATVDTPVEELLSSDVVPFTGLIDAGAPVVMLGHVTYSALDGERPASLSPASYELLRDLGFDGVAMTDSLGMGAIHRRWDFPVAAVMALRAGADAVLATDGRQAAAMTSAIVRAVRRGKLDEARLDEAVARMLALKGVDPGVLSCAGDVVGADPRGAQLLAAD